MTIDLLVHASGILGGTYARKQTFDQWRATISANLDSCFVVTSAALPRMKPGSRFVFISSSAAHEPMMARTAYSASKAGMNAFAGALAREVDRDGINVHIVTPGPVETEMLQDVPFEMYAIRAADVADAVAWLDTLDPSVDLPEIRLHAITRGPSARAPVVPLEVERRAPPSDFGVISRAERMVFTPKSLAFAGQRLDGRRQAVQRGRVAAHDPLPLVCREPPDRPVRAS